MISAMAIAYCMIAAAFAIYLAANRDSWLARQRDAGRGEPAIDFALAFLWGLFWPVMLIVWWSRSRKSPE